MPNTCKAAPAGRRRVICTVSCAGVRRCDQVPCSWADLVGAVSSCRRSSVLSTPSSWGRRVLARRARCSCRTRRWRPGRSSSPTRKASSGCTRAATTTMPGASRRGSRRPPAVATGSRCVPTPARRTCWRRRPCSPTARAAATPSGGWPRRRCAAPSSPTRPPCRRRRRPRPTRCWAAARAGCWPLSGTASPWARASARRCWATCAVRCWPASCWVSVTAWPG